MDNLKTIIETFSKEDQREFSAFVKRQRKTKNRKDLELFRILKQSKSYKPKEIVAMLYPESYNQVAYHALRKRLMRHVIDYVVLKRMEEDTSTSSSIMGMISLARYLFDKGRERIAWMFLHKSEKSALEAEFFDLLNTIYNLQIEHAQSEFADELSIIIKKYEENKQKADEDERANIANSVIKQQLRRLQLSGQTMDFDEVIQDNLRKYNLEEAVSQRPRLLYKLMSIARSAVLVKKDYYDFAPYIINQYELLEKNHGFAPSQQFYKLSLLHMIAHVLYRSKRFSDSIHYLDQMKLELDRMKGFHETFYPKYALLLAANYAFNYQSDKAAGILENLLNKHHKLLETKDELNAIINLGLYYFHQEKYKKVVECVLLLNHSDQWYEKKMGKEWVLKKNLCEMFFYYDYGDYDLAFNKLRSIERNSKDFFKQANYQNALNFLKLIKSFF
ncbi:MAG: hypothetical protein ACPGJS_21155, partial [Flammeovirgaceae bacterium]